MIPFSFKCVLFVYLWHFITGRVNEMADADKEESIFNVTVWTIDSYKYLKKICLLISVHMKHCFMALHEFALFPLSASCRALHLIYLSHNVPCGDGCHLHLWGFRLFCRERQCPAVMNWQFKTVHILSKPWVTTRTTASSFSALCLLVPGLNCDDLVCFALECNAFTVFGCICKKCILHNYKHLISALAFVLINLYSYHFIWLYLLFFLVMELWHQLLTCEGYTLYSCKTRHVQNKVKEPLPQCVHDHYNLSKLFCHQSYSLCQIEISRFP